MNKGYVYLIGEEENVGKYKIGSTRATDVGKRLKQLQTGNPNHLYIKCHFETNKPFKLEKMLHNKFKEYKVMNEWFELNDYEIECFDETCSKMQTIIDSLNENPFFK